MGQRRMSDPSQAWNKFMRGSFKGRGVRKSQSEADNVDVAGGDATTEVEASSVEEGCSSRASNATQIGMLFVSRSRRAGR